MVGLKDRMEKEGELGIVEIMVERFFFRFRV